MIDFLINFLHRFGKIQANKYHDVQYISPCVVSEKPSWFALAIPHGYLKFRGQGWRVWAVNMGEWLAYKFYDLND